MSDIEWNIFTKDKTNKPHSCGHIPPILKVQLFKGYKRLKLLQYYSGQQMSGANSTQMVTLYLQCSNGSTAKRTLIANKKSKTKNTDFID